MVRNSLLVLLAALVAGCGDTQNTSASASSTQAHGGRWARLKQDAAKRIEAFANYGKPRFVPRGAKPEIIVEGERLFIAGTHVMISQPFEIWAQAIPGTPRCNSDRNLTCNWDDLGITVLTEGNLAKEFSVYLNLEPWRHWATKAPDGTPIPPTPDPRPKHPFPGYFEWDGYGIDANTRFWEIRASVSPERNVRCDLFTNSCGNTTARFNDHAKIYLELYQTIHENGRLASFAIAR
jgi:hypothetical protein